MRGNADGVLVELDDEGRDSGVEAEPSDGSTLAQARTGASPDGIQSPFDPSKIDVDTKNPTIDLLLSRLRRGALDLEPDFQRAAGIWTQAAQSRLIESLLLRIPLPTIYAAEEVADDSWTVIDGVQRLTAVARFVEPEAVGAQPLELQGLEYLAYNGKTFSQLPPALQTRIRETEVVVHLIKKGTPEEVKFNIFARINTGGMPLSFQELRHALIPGKARDLLKDLAGSSEFQRATLGSVSPTRMADREMALRFLAFMITPPEKYRTGDLNEFLRTAMHAINQSTDAYCLSLKTDFARAMRAAAKIFGEHAFRKLYRGQTRRLPINKAIFEAVCVGLASLSDAQLETLIDKRFRVQERYMDLMEDKVFNAAVSVGTGDVGKVGCRFGSIRKMFSEAAGTP